ncbi:MAG: RluA family pseudouridine synthase [Candidatus Binatia bacterium]
MASCCPSASTGWPRRISTSTPSSAERTTVERGGVRLDKLVAVWLGCGRRGARTLLRTGRILVDGHRCSASACPQRGSVLDLLPETTPPRAPSDRPPCVVWEDAGLLAIDKPAGLHTVLGRGAESAEALLRRAHPELATVRELSGDSAFVHRLDRDTSGVVLAARDIRSWRSMRAAFSERRVDKRYLAIVEGRVTASMRIDRALARRRSRVVAAGARDRALIALSEVEPVEIGRDWSLVCVRMRTGVTHQIRAHLALAGHPIVGDLKYGGIPAPAGSRAGQLLHAWRIAIDVRLDVTVPAPADFEAALARLRAGPDAATS